MPCPATASGSTNLGTAPDWYRAKMEPMRTSPGSQTITFADTTWTPQAVRITFAETATLNAETAGGSISQGFSDLTNVRCTSMSVSQSRTRGLTDKVLASYDLAYQATVSGAAGGQITLNVTHAAGAVCNMLVEVFGGPLVNGARVGSLSVPAAGTTVVNVGFEANLIFQNGDREAGYPGNLTSSSVWDLGFTTQRSARVRQALKAIIYASGDYAISAFGSGAVNVVGVNANSIAFDNRQNAFTLNSMFLALGLDPSVDLWAGLAYLPANPGTNDLVTPAALSVEDNPAIKMAPPFTPRAMIFGANRAEVGEVGGSRGNSFANGSISAIGQFMIGARKAGSAIAGAIAARNNGIDVPDRTGGDPYSGSVLGFGTDEVNFQATAQQAVTRPMAVLLIGSDGVEPARADAINPARTGSGIILSNNNFVMSKTANGSAEPTCQVTRGRDAATASHYFEGSMGSSYPEQALKFGVANGSKSLSTAMGTDANSWTYIDYLDGTKGHNGVYTAYGLPLKDGDVVGVLLKNGKLYFAKNGVWVNGADLGAETGFAFSGLTGTLFPSASIYKNGTGAQDRMGAFHLYTDQFRYPIPAGASAWCA